MIILYTILFSILSGILYRMGGSDKYNTKVRDLGVPTIMIVYMTILGHYHWSLFLSFLLLFGALTTYWKQAEKRFGFWAHGLGIAISILPFVICSHLWVGFLIRSIVLTLFIMLWSEYEGNAVREEFGRGFSIIATLPLLYIGS